ncbi:hypothetical protein MKK58_19000 [Methylobacterium sp. J-078]|uniref:hypothetical protein n=1 Tax=Methylobacterium sp. J-078 TaxID=2836657 RepID=UPI001FBBA433|nr:hypothetical protein [Methylobacterium sp. J-078]MCJ2046607.1 hypothetical protein [Methylobacterium sp. J-078]
MTETSSTTDEAEAAFLDLHAQREDLERQLSMARMRQQFGTGQDDVERAGSEEKTLLLSLDRVLTQIRAAEYRRRPNSRRW